MNTSTPPPASSNQPESKQNIPPDPLPQPQTGQPIKPRRVHVITNPAAGKRQPLLAILNDIFQANQVDWEVFVTKQSGDAQRLAQESAQAGVDLVAACGGDGTVMEVANGLIGTDVPMAIFPSGTANVMSLELGIPLDIAQAVALASEGNNTLRAVDMGQANNSNFLLRIGIGMEAHIILRTEREAKTRWGNLAYILTGLAELTNPTVANYVMVLDGLRMEVDAISVMVANSGNMGIQGVNIVPGVDVSDGMLDVVVIRRGDLPSLLTIARSSFLDPQEIPDSVLHWKTREVQITAKPEQLVQADGEDIGVTPLSVRILPRAVKIVCPIPAPSLTDQESPTS